MINVELIQESGTNPRENFNDAKLHELAASIKLYGLIQAIIVREIELSPVEQLSGAPQRYQIVSGARRYRAHLQIKETQIRAEIVNLPDEQVKLVQVIENLHREDLNPLELAKRFSELLKDDKYSVDEIATRMGKSRKYVYQYLMLVKLIPEAAAMLHAGNLPVNHAIRLSGLTDKQQKKSLKWLVSYPFGEHEAPLIRPLNEFEQWLKETFFLLLVNAPWSKSDETLLPKAGSCIACDKRTRVQQALFSDNVGNTDSCMDSKCFAAKMAAHIEQKAAAIEVNIGVRPILIAQNYDKKLPDNIVYAFNTTIVPEESRCKKCSIGMYVNGEQTGCECFVCIDECHTQKTANPTKASSKNNNDPDKVETAAYKLIALEGNNPGSLTDTPLILKAATAQLWEGLHLGDARLMMERWGWTTEFKDLDYLEANNMLQLFYKFTENYTPYQMQGILMDITLFLSNDADVKKLSEELGVNPKDKSFKQLKKRLSVASTPEGWEEVSSAKELYSIATKREMIDFLSRGGWDYKESWDGYRLAKEVMEYIK